jgi:DNA polymerase-3 subunit beta
MEFVCSKKELQSGVSAVEKIVTTRSTLPIIGNILFEANKSGLQISANNLEMGIKLAIKAKIQKEGAVLLPARTLGGIVSKLPDKNVGFKLSEKGTVRITYDKSHFNVHTLPPDEFPVLPKVKEGKSFSIDPRIFASMIKQTIFAVSSNEEKYVLTGALLEVGKASLAGDSSNVRLVATDGYRLAKRGESIKLGGGEGGISVIVPAKTLQELSRLLELGKKEEDLRVTVSSDQIAFKYLDVYLVSRVIQGQFPDYKQVIPKKSATKIALNSRAFLEAAERTAVIASGSANIVRFEIKADSLHMSASTPDVGTIDEVVAAEIKGEKKAQMAFNIRLISDMLKAVENEGVVLELAESLGPGTIRQDEKGNYLYIVMPIRTQEGG